jgi:hypothetical protein
MENKKINRLISTGDTNYKETKHNFLQSKSDIFGYDRF